MGPDGNIYCDRQIDCPTLPIWTGLNKVINDYLNGISLQDIIDQSRIHGSDEYVI